MITVIEEAVLNLITTRLAELKAGAIQKGAQTLLTSNSVAVAVLEGEFERVTRLWQQQLTVSVLVKFKNMTSEEARRKGINPIVQGIVQLLMDNDLGLKISPLRPSRFRDVTTEEKYQAGIIEYLIEFNTVHTLVKLDKEEVTDLFTVGLAYYLKPGDDLADASDEVKLEGAPQ